ncbi:hypothetical protein Ntsu_40380 [Nocardia sp. IFM 10818]
MRDATVRNCRPHPRRWSLLVNGPVRAATPPRKFYTLNDAGRKELETCWAEVFGSGTVASTARE